MYETIKSYYSDKVKNNRSRMNDTTDYGPEPFVINIEEATLRNNAFRRALWTGNNLQLTLMSIPRGSEIGLEIHNNNDQFLRIEEGTAIVKMGYSKDNLDYLERVSDNDVILVPAGVWHNIINTGNGALKVYSIYAPPHHLHGTLHETKEDAMAEEENY